jgi:hypothetical protein
VALRAAVPYQELGSSRGRFEIPFLGTLYYVYWPDGRVEGAKHEEEPDIVTRLILLHYLHSADGVPVASQWIAFRNLPGGLGYEGAFHARASQRLAQTFRADQHGLNAAGRLLGAETLSFGDASLLFRALPRVWLAVVLYVEDEEFPASANVLFDEAASHYLPTEDLAVLGGLLASRLIRAAHPA